LWRLTIPIYKKSTFNTHSIISHRGTETQSNANKTTDFPYFAERRRDAENNPLWSLVILVP